jgi:transcriptional regulator with XRE-family HTH domain
MSMGDELRYLRARAGGVTPSDIAEATGVEPGLYSQLEQRYREMGDDATLQKLADYFDCDVDMLKRARSRSRKALTRHLEKALQSGQSASLRLRTGEVFTGRVVWWDLGTLGLEPEDGGPVLVIQRHAVVEW